MKLQKLLSLVRQAVEKYEMIHEGDRIAVGVSGGKDSLTLLLHLGNCQDFIRRSLKFVQSVWILDLEIWITARYKNFVNRPELHFLSYRPR